MEPVGVFVEVQVLVPRERLAEFYEWHGRWLRAQDEFMDLPASFFSKLVRSDLTFQHEGELQGVDTKTRKIENVEPARFEPSPWGGQNEKPGEWSGDALAAAINIYDKVSPGAKKIIDVLLDQPGEKITGERLAKQLGHSEAQLTGTLASVGIRSKAVRREVPFRYESGPSSGRYWIEPELATLLSWARAQPPEIVALAAYYDEQTRVLIEQEAGAVEMIDELRKVEPEGGPIEIPQSMIDTSILTKLFEIEHELDREFRRAMNLPIPEKPEWRRVSGRTTEQRELDSREETAMDGDE